MKIATLLLGLHLLQLLQLLLLIIIIIIIKSFIYISERTDKKNSDG